MDEVCMVTDRFEDETVAQTYITFVGSSDEATTRLWVRRLLARSADL
jgi:hypothetical protein